MNPSPHRAPRRPDKGLYVAYALSKKYSSRNFGERAMTIAHRGRTYVVCSEGDLLTLVFSLQQLERLAA